jgi:hypothetical protein
MSAIGTSGHLPNLIERALSRVKRTLLTLASRPLRKFKAQKGATCACRANFPCAKNQAFERYCPRRGGWSS